MKPGDLESMLERAGVFNRQWRANIIMTVAQIVGRAQVLAFFMGAAAALSIVAVFK